MPDIDTTPLTRQDYEQRTGHAGMVLWLTGQPGAGKTTLARGLERSLHSRGIHTHVIDGDEIRKTLCQGLGFSAEDRAENIRRVACMAQLLCQTGQVVIVALVSPYIHMREAARTQIGDADFHEIYCECDTELCIRRDPKGMHSKAVKGEIRGFTGVTAPYEAPPHARLVLQTGRTSPAEALQQLLDYTLHRLDRPSSPS
jgi:adenylyl-sulfate kinase